MWGTLTIHYHSFDFVRLTQVRNAQTCTENGAVGEAQSFDNFLWISHSSNLEGTQVLSNKRVHGMLLISQLG